MKSILMSIMCLVLAGCTATLSTSASPLETSASRVPATKEACKSGAWQTLRREDGRTFKNQGDCVSYVETGR